MKKQFLLAVGAVATALVMTGCMATHTNDAASGVEVKVTKTYEADIAAGRNAVSGEATVHNLFGIITWGVSSFADDAFVSTTAAPLQLSVSPATVAKQGATFNACKSAFFTSLCTAVTLIRLLSREPKSALLSERTFLLRSGR